MKILIRSIILFIIISISGCFNMYNEALDDLNDEYNYFLAVSGLNSIVSVFSLDSSDTPNTPPNNYSIGGNNSYPAVHPSNNYLYIPNLAASTLLVYKINNYGQLELVESETTGGGPYAVKVHPTGKYVYVSNYLDATISMFQVNSNGTLDSLGSPVITFAGTNARRIDIDPSGSNLYVINGDGNTSSISVFQIGSDGLLTQVTGSPVTNLPDNNTNPHNILVHPNGKFLYVTSYLLLPGPTPYEIIYIYEIRNGSNPPLQYITYTTIVQDDTRSSIAIHPNGSYLYAKSGYTSPVLAFQINSNGTLTNIDSTSPDDIASGYCEIIVHPNGKSLFVLDAGGGDRLNYNIRLNGNGTFNHSYTHMDYTFSGTNNCEGFVLFKKKKI